MNDCVQHTLQGTVRDESVLVVGGDSLVVVRYAIPLLAMPHLAVVPCVFVSSQGDMLRGWRAWHFVQHNYQLQPRAEIVGLRSDGDEAMNFLRELDFGAVPWVLAYESTATQVPVARINRLEIEDTSIDVPDLMVRLLVKE